MKANFFLLWLIISVSISCRNDDSRLHFFKNENDFTKLQKIISQNYYSFKEIDRNPYHDHISLNETEFNSKCHFLREDELMFFRKCFENKTIQYVEIYKNDCISFTINETDNFASTTIRYIVFCSDIKLFNSISKFSQDVLKYDKLKSNWYYLERKVSLAN